MGRGDWQMKDITGQRFDRMIALERVRSGTGAKWLCRCDCGTERVVLGRSLREGHTRSCGCFRDETRSAIRKRHNGTQGGKAAPVYRVWKNMTQRCGNPNNPRYADYAGRGIRVCDRWKGRDGFIHFLADMGDRPSSKHSIDRIDPNGNYEPGNCRWATALEQNRNQRLSSARVSRILADMKAASVDLLERSVLDRVRIALLGA